MSLRVFRLLLKPASRRKPVQIPKRALLLDKPLRQGNPLPDDVVPVLVAPYLVACVRDRSRSIEEDPLALFWVPGQLMPDGSLQSDPDHLPFVSRELLDPAISDRKEVPPPIASWNEYESTIRAMGVDWEEVWNDRIEHAKEMFQLVAGVEADEWEADGCQ
jgi:hypothetical protein